MGSGRPLRRTSGLLSPDSATGAVGYLARFEEMRPTLELREPAQKTSNLGRKENVINYDLGRWITRLVDR
jgi:hypothetical protein